MITWEMYTHEGEIEDDRVSMPILGPFLMGFSGLAVWFRYEWETSPGNVVCHGLIFAVMMISFLFLRWKEKKQVYWKGPVIFMIICSFIMAPSWNVFLTVKSPEKVEAVVLDKWETSGSRSHSYGIIVRDSEGNTKNSTVMYRIYEDAEEGDPINILWYTNLFGGRYYRFEL